MSPTSHEDPAKVILFVGHCWPDLVPDAQCRSEILGGDMTHIRESERVDVTFFVQLSSDGALRERPLGPSKVTM